MKNKKISLEENSANFDQTQKADTVREKFDRRNTNAVKQPRKRENSHDNTREASCTNRKNRDKSLYASHNISTISPSDIYDDDIAYLSQTQKISNTKNS